MDLSHARALIPASVHPHIEEYKPQHEAAVLHKLACWALRFAPVVAVDPPDGLLLDITGLAPLYPGSGERGLTRAVGLALCKWELSVRMAVASTFACAQALARFAEAGVTIAPSGEDEKLLAPLPVEALRLEAGIESALREVGLTRVGDVLNLSHSALAAQFGDELLRRIDRALGTAAEIIEPVRLDPPPRIELLFDGATDRWDALEAAARDVLDRLVAALVSRGQSARRLDLEVLRPQGPREHVCIKLSRASRARRHLWAMLHTRLERIDTQAGVEGVALTAGDLEWFKHQQIGFSSFCDDAGDESAWGELMDNLVNHVGANRVVRFEPAESHLPERAFRETPIMEDTSRTTSAAVTTADRPTRLFERPRPARVMALTPDGPILSISYDGRDRRVIYCEGPERIGPEWWRWPPTGEHGGGPPPDRDYFTVQLEDGTRQWVCRQVGTGRWFIHGDWI